MTYVNLVFLGLMIMIFLYPSELDFNHPTFQDLIATVVLIIMISYVFAYGFISILISALGPLFT